jgi:ribosomal protein L7/L12
MESKNLVESWGTSLEPEWEAEARTELRNGDKIKAIKLVRAGTGIGHREAKELVEFWQKDL